MYKRNMTDEEKEKYNAYHREYYKKNKEKIKETCRKYYKNNKEKVSATQKKYRQNNKDKVRAKNRRYAQNNREKINEYHKNYRQKNLEKMKAYEKDYYLKNKEVINARSMERYYRIKRKKERLKNITFQVPKAERLARQHEELLERYKVPDHIVKELTTGVGRGDRKVYMLIDKESLEPVRAVTTRTILNETGKSIGAVKYLIDHGEYDGCYICEE